jgi:hypothetical protein
MFTAKPTPDPKLPPPHAPQRRLDLTASEGRGRAVVPAEIGARAEGRRLQPTTCVGRHMPVLGRVEKWGGGFRCRPHGLRLAASSSDGGRGGGDGWQQLGLVAPVALVTATGGPQNLLLLELVMFPLSLEDADY